ncbi:MAG: hypothetical protein IJD07_04545 [Clostridia bacterium]|nr:hypothetical protein [Clostridia bacterium]
MKKSLYILILILVALTLSSAPPVTAKAESMPMPEIFNLNGQTIYGYLDNPEKIYSDQDKIYVTLAGGKVKVFENFSINQELTISCKKFTVYRDKHVYLDGTTLHFGEITLANVNDFAFCGDILVTAYDDVITHYDLNNDETLSVGTEYFAVGKVEALSKNGFYYTVNEGSNYEAHAIYLLQNGQSILIDEMAQSISTLYATDSALYCLSASELIGYNVVDGIYTISNQIIVSAKDFTVLGDKIYLISRYAAIEELSLNLDAQKTVVASASSDDYFYNKPSAISAKLGKIIVSDRMNNRLSVIDSDGGIKQISIVRPIAAASDSEGNIYVVTQSSLVKLSEDGSIIKQTALLGASDIAVGSDDKIYVLCTQGLLTADTELNLSEEVISAKTICIFNGKISYYDGQTVYLGENALLSCEGITSYAIDASKNLFYIKDGVLYRYDGIETALCAVDGKLIISSIKTDYVGYGDILIVDTDRHCIYKLNRLDVGAADIEQLYDIPSLEIEEDALQIKGNLIAKTLKKVKLFKTPAEAEITAEVGAGTNVIIHYDADCPEEYYYVMFDDVENLSLKGGYVYASSISEPLKYELAPISVGKINTNNTKIYKWPSIKSPTVKGVIKNKNDTVSIIPFATNHADEYAKRWYQDGYGKKWYRISIDDTHEGFVMASDITTEFYKNEKMPDTNAVITDYALVYHYDATAKKYVPIDDLWIAKDTRVKVDTPFDSSQKFTKVVFYRDGYGTIDIECYVETKYVEFDGVDLLQFVAIAIIIATIILGVVLIARKVRQNKRKSILSRTSSRDYQ